MNNIYVPEELASRVRCCLRETIGKPNTQKAIRDLEYTLNELVKSYYKNQRPEYSFKVKEDPSDSTKLFVGIEMSGITVDFRIDEEEKVKFKIGDRVKVIGEKHGWRGWSGEIEKIYFQPKIMYRLWNAVLWFEEDELELINLEKKMEKIKIEKENVIEFDGNNDKEIYEMFPDAIRGFESTMSIVEYIGCYGQSERVPGNLIKATCLLFVKGREIHSDIFLYDHFVKHDDGSIEILSKEEFNKKYEIEIKEDHRMTLKNENVVYCGSISQVLRHFKDPQLSFFVLPDGRSFIKFNNHYDGYSLLLPNSLNFYFVWDEHIARYYVFETLGELERLYRVI